MTQISEAIAKRQQFLEATLKDQVTKMDTLQEQSIKHARLTNDTLTKEVTRIEKVMSTMEQYMKHQVSDLQGQINSLTQDTQKWQVNFEDMQARKILEIHQAIKVLNQNYVFMQRDTKDKFEILTDQQRSNTDKVMIQVKDLKKHFKGLPLGGDNNENRNQRNTSNSPTRNGGSPGGRMAPADAVSKEELSD